MATLQPMSEDVVPLDGNAIAGDLSEIFAVDVTVATIVCGQCGSSAEIGAIRVYGGAMGSILRCAYCDNAVMRLARTPRAATLDLRGARSMVMRRS